MSTFLWGGPLFDGQRVYQHGAILFDEYQIHALGDSEDSPNRSWAPVHVDGALMAPALVDLHCDVLEKCIEMRPGVYFDPEFALQALDRRLAAAGIGTFFHGISFVDNDQGLRSPEKAADLIETIRKFAQSGKATVHHLVHARYEIGSQRAAHVLMELLDEGAVDLASIMDHTPGQGQFRSFEAYHRYYSGTYKLSRKHTLAMAREKRQMRAEGWRQVRQLTQRIIEKGIPLLSHDDDTVEKVRFVADLGVKGSEFPISLEAAQEAKARSMAVLVGAPNVLRGASSNGHLSARSAVAEGVVDAIVSDYYPESLVQAPFLLAQQLGGDVEDHLTKVTGGPSRILGPSHGCGHLAPGLPADVVVLRLHGPWVQVIQLWINGRKVYQGADPVAFGLSVTNPKRFPLKKVALA